MQTISFLSVIIILLSLCSMFYFSWTSRTRYKEGAQHVQAKGLMNISMGILFFAIASFQFTLPTSNNWRYVLIGIIYLGAWINLYYGIKRYRFAKS